MSRGLSRLLAPLLLAAALLLAGPSCGSKNRSQTSVLPASSSEATDLGLEELRKGLESTVLENYVQLTLGNIEAFSDGVALEREVQLVGVTPRDVVIGVRPPGLLEDRRLYHRRRGLRILSKNLDVHLSQDGSVGWVYDEISYRVEYMGREASIPIRSTEVYVRDLERWVLAAEHQSYGLPIEEVINLAARDELAEPEPIDTGYGGSKSLSASLVGLVGRFVNGDVDGAVVESDASLLLLPGPDQEFVGRESSRAPSLALSFGPRATVAVRDFRVQLADSERVAWMLCNLVVRTELNGDRLEIPLRGSFVLERRREADWGLVQAHVSAPLLEQQLSERVFGPIE